MKNLAGLMKQASQMQKKMEEMQARLESLDVEGSAGAGMVSVTLNGKGDLKSVRIDPKLADPERDRDAAGPDRRRACRGAAQDAGNGGRGDAEAHGRAGTCRRG